MKNQIEKIFSMTAIIRATSTTILKLPYHCHTCCLLAALVFIQPPKCPTRLKHNTIKGKREKGKGKEDSRRNKKSLVIKISQIKKAKQ